MKDTINMEYNTTRNHLIIKEYGRHIQKMVDYVLTIEDKEKRQKNANAVIELMGILNPHLKNVEDFKHKLWDHLFLISDFKLDVESPYPIPTREELFAKPDPLPYPKKYPKYKHLGRNIEVVIHKALKEEDAEKKQGFANAVAYYMKLTYSTWHKELMHDDAIQNELSTITKGELEFNNKPFIKHVANIRTEEYPTNGRNQHRKNYGSRDNRQQGQTAQSGQAGNRNRNNNTGGSSSNNNNNNNNNTNSGGNRNSNNRNFKKRF